MGLINTNNQLAIFESINAWIKRPKHIMQKSSVIYIGGVWYDRTPEYPDPDQLMLVATFATFGKTLPNAQISSQSPFVSHPIPYSKKAYDHHISTSS